MNLGEFRRDREIRTTSDEVREMLRMCRAELRRAKGVGRIVKMGTAFGDASDDTEIAADIMLGDLCIRHAANMTHIGTIVCEGRAPIVLDPAKPFTMFVDPLDGSLNFATKGDALGLPYSTAVTVTHSDSPLFADVLCAAIIDLRCTAREDLWESTLGVSGYLTLLRGKPCRAERSVTLSLANRIVIGEMYYPENRARLVRAFEGEKGWLRSPGSAAYEMALVASGTAAAFICDRQKNHELGAAYALVQGADGVAVDFDGVDLGMRPYDFGAQTPVVLAGNRLIANAVLERLNR